MSPMPKQKPGKSKQDYATPIDLIQAVLHRLAIDRFKFDFAADAFNHKAGQWWGEADDSLSKSPKAWALKTRDGWGWLNPPFANIGRWAIACVLAMQAGADIAFLVPASVGANWYRDYINAQPGVKVIFLNGRPSFDGIAPFPKDCMLVLFQGSFKDAPFSTEVWTWE